VADAAVNKENNMKTLILGVALAALLSAAPAIAKDKQSLKGSDAQQSSAMDQENANRTQNPDGTFQGKPVVQGPADWHNSSASSGASSGESGSDASGGSSK
jgi:hypothetical protein